jgi:hypothetical protein
MRGVSFTDFCRATQPPESGLPGRHSKSPKSRSFPAGVAVIKVGAATEIEMEMEMEMEGKKAAREDRKPRRETGRGFSVFGPSIGAAEKCPSGDVTTSIEP